MYIITFTVNNNLRMRQFENIEEVQELIKFLKLNEIKFSIDELNFNGQSKKIYGE